MSSLGRAAPPIKISKTKAVERLDQAQQRLLLGDQIGDHQIGPAGRAARMSA